METVPVMLRLQRQSPNVHEGETRSIRFFDSRRSREFPRESWGDGNRTRGQNRRISRTPAARIGSARYGLDRRPRW